MEQLIYLVVLLVIFVGSFYIVKLYLIKTEEEKLLPYKAKQYLFNKSEHEFLKELHRQLDANRYMIFPKVRLADFIEVAVRGKEYQGWWNKIRSKHVDFLVWDAQNNKIAFAIELDGRSHQSEKVQKRDDFINRLYERVEVRLERVKTGGNYSVSIAEMLKY